MFNVVIRIALLGSMFAVSSCGKPSTENFNLTKVVASLSKAHKENSSSETGKASGSHSKTNLAHKVSSNFDINKKAYALSSKAQKLDPKVIKLGLTAYKNAQQKGLVQQPVLTIVDFSKASTEQRLYVFDLKNENLLFQELVTHGKNSGSKIPTSFSNKPESLKSSIGVFLTKNTYSGKFGRSLRIEGLEKGVNNLAATRSIVVHASKYVSSSMAQAHNRLARSWGCFAVRPAVSKALISTIKDGSVIFAYAPDKNYLSTSTYLSLT